MTTMSASKSHATYDRTLICKRFAFIIIVILIETSKNSCNCKPSLWTGTLTQSTFYYADYKLPPKSLKLKRLFLPGPQNCPETGFTVCKDVTTFPENEAFEIIQHSSAERFNFTSVFSDDSANDEEPIFQTSQTQEPEVQKQTPEGYIVYQTALHYNYAPQSVYPTQQHKYGHDAGYGQSHLGNNQRNQGKPIYQNFDQTFDQNYDRNYGHKYDRSSSGNSNYAQNNDQTYANNYDQISTQNVGDYIGSQVVQNYGKVNQDGNKGVGQVPVTKTNKGQSPRSRPSYRSPVARGLALAGQKGRRKESRNEGFDTKSVGGGKDGVKGGSDGTKGSKPAVKGSPSTPSKQRSPLRKDPELAINLNPHNYNKNPWRPIFSKRSTVDTNATDEINRISDNSSDANELQRPKRQIDEVEEICRTRKMYITPKAALNDKSEWKYIINLGEKDPQFKQVVKVDVCISPGEPCSNQISLPFGFISRCKQKYLKKKLLSLDADGEGTSTENFFVPSCCVCEIIRPSKRK